MKRIKSRYIKFVLFVFTFSVLISSMVAPASASVDNILGFGKYYEARASYDDTSFSDRYPVCYNYIPYSTDCLYIGGIFSSDSKLVTFYPWIEEQGYYTLSDIVKDHVTDNGLTVGFTGLTSYLGDGSFVVSYECNSYDSSPAPDRVIFTVKDSARQAFLNSYNYIPVLSVSAYYYSPFNTQAGTGGNIPTPEEPFDISINRYQSGIVHLFGADGILRMNNKPALIKPDGYSSCYYGLSIDYSQIPSLQGYVFDDDGNVTFIDDKYKPSGIRFVFHIDYYSDVSLTQLVDYSGICQSVSAPFDIHFRSDGDTSYQMGYDDGRSDGYIQGVAQGKQDCANQTHQTLKDNAFSEGIKYCEDHNHSTLRDQAYANGISWCESTHDFIMSEAFTNGVYYCESTFHDDIREDGIRVGKAECLWTHDEIREEARQEGYDSGFTEGTSFHRMILDGSNSLLKVPFTILDEGFNFEVLGFNIAAGVRGLFTLLVVAAVVVFVSRYI